MTIQIHETSKEDGAYKANATVTLADMTFSASVNLGFSENNLAANKGKTHCYVSDAISANPIQDMISGYRYNRPSEWYLTWLPELIKDVLAALKLPTRKFKLVWSQYAGCNCPCSPGFLVRGKELYSISTIWVTLADLTPNQLTTIVNHEISIGEGND